MSVQYMILPAADPRDLRLLQIPPDFEQQEAYRRVTALLAAVQEADPQCSWEDMAQVLESQGFTPLAYVLGPSLDPSGEMGGEVVEMV